MKHLLTILLFTVSFNCASQQKVQSYKMTMNVRAVRVNGEIVCKNGIQVIWGVHEGTYSFIAEGRELVFRIPTTNEIWCTPEERLHYIAQVQMYQGPDAYIKIVVNDKNEKYLLKIITIDGDIAIYLINIHEGLPTYQFGFGCNECAPHELASK